MSFLAPLVPSLIGAAGTYLATKAAADAARPATEAQTRVAQTEQDVINALLKQYRDLYAPYEQALVGRQAGLLAGLPIEQITQETLESLRGPFVMPEPIVMRALLGVQQQQEREETDLRRDLARRGIEGPAAESLIQDIRERGLMGKYGVLSDVMRTEAEQTLANQGRAFDIVNTLMGQGLQTAMSGRSMMPGIMSGLQHLAGMYGQAAAGAAAPWAQFAGAIPGAVGAYYQYKYSQPQPASYGGYGGGGGRVTAY